MNAASPVNVGRSVRVSAFTVVLALGVLTGCSTMRGRADDALKKGDYVRAVQLYTQVLREHPDDPDVRRQLIKAERGLFDQLIARIETARKADDGYNGIRITLEAMQLGDRVRPESLDEPRRASLKSAIEWTGQSIQKTIQVDIIPGHALAARARRKEFEPWLARRELASLGPEIDKEIDGAGVLTCKKAIETASQGEQPYALEIVASYCKAFNGPMPGWKQRPLVVSGLILRGDITGTPSEEQAELERVVQAALEKSDWFSPVSPNKATLDLKGTMTASFSTQQTEQSRPWTEQVPYQATETYSDPVRVPYMEMETYYEDVPYTAYEQQSVPCTRGRTPPCTATRPVTKMRSVAKQRQVTRYRTDYVEKTRVVTRMRDEPRVFSYRALKHQGVYQASWVGNIVMGPAAPHVRPIPIGGSTEDTRVAFEHDISFPPAGVSPERGTLPTALAWRQQNREKLAQDIYQRLESSFMSAFCSETIGVLEDAARCAHARPSPVPNAVRGAISTLFSGDDPDQILALPRPKEAAE